MSTLADEPQKHWLEYSIPARSRPLLAQTGGCKELSGRVSQVGHGLGRETQDGDAQSVQTVCVMVDDSVEASLKSRPLAPSSRQRLVLVQPLERAAGVAETAGLWKMWSACPPPQILSGAPAQAVMEPEVSLWGEDRAVESKLGDERELHCVEGLRAVTSLSQ